MHNQSCESDIRTHVHVFGANDTRNYDSDQSHLSLQMIIDVYP